MAIGDDVFGRGNHTQAECMQFSMPGTQAGVSGLGCCRSGRRDILRPPSGCCGCWA